MKNAMRFRRKLLNRYMRHLLAWQNYFTQGRKSNRYELKLWRALELSARRADRHPFPLPE